MAPHADADSKTSPLIHPHAHLNSKGPVSVGIRAPFGHDPSQQQRLLAVSAVELDRTILSEPGHVRIAWRVTVAKPLHLKQRQKSTCKDAFRHIS